MIDEGFVKQAWEDAVKKDTSGESTTTTTTCSAGKTNAEQLDAEASQRLTFKSMAGIFILHGAISVFSIVLTLIAKYTGCTKARSRRLEEYNKQQQRKQEILEKRELMKTIESEIRRTIATKDVERQQVDTTSPDLLECTEVTQLPGSMTAGDGTEPISAELLDNIPAVVRETIHELRSEMQRSQNQLSIEIRKSQHAHAEEITEIRDEVASIQEEVQNSTQPEEIKAKMDRILKILNNSKGKSSVIDDVRGGCTSTPIASGTFAPVEPTDDAPIEPANVGSCG
mmetsp:Transcript_31952/g.47161  ORF Transcript_31952/g.47161 Transcript_31952/m.47161 type:complete len:284 (+) Transcript_31952:1-852(+)